ncbi:MAG: glycosyltransferase family 9 protein [Candidatus Pedobacter colombiensis]|uniref:Glycosyltransferase family 9 protein n=1 Tax=Candidatus Pedobacter colombiensis TaxID=3121371 RepID=A0AAJ5W468_9SPHI|nr:glycosyltransferase family 9 protein [Pedobacter sp.]WEK18203.1 MAG: glycosyltransferase family 9 protein [Pedobacter sp.]
MTGANKILVIRFSAMGDVAMTAPVLKEFIRDYPDTELLMVSRTLFKPFFKDIPNLSFYSFDPKVKHKGFLGLIKLFIALRKERITAVADLHNNLRSKILCTFFTLTGVKVAVLDKGRKEKAELTRKENKLFRQLKPTLIRYADVFKELGFPFVLKNSLEKSIPDALPGETFPFARLPKTKKWIGVSPFARHQQKVYPLLKMETVLLALADAGHQLFIFGGTDEEARIATQWEAKYENITSVVKKIKLEDELKLISNLDIMLSMDSSGMHLASLKNIPVVSVWGATHPYAGFLGYGQSMNDAVQIDLYCRPCSIYGNIPCYRGDFACMNNLSESVVINSVLNKLSNG